MRKILHFYSLYNSKPNEGVAGRRSGCGVCIVQGVTLPVWPGAMLDVEQRTSLRSGSPSRLSDNICSGFRLFSERTHIHTWTLSARTHTQTNRVTGWLRLPWKRQDKKSKDARGSQSSASSAECNSDDSSFSRLHSICKIQLSLWQPGKE